MKPARSITEYKGQTFTTKTLEMSTDKRAPHEAPLYFTHKPRIEAYSIDLDKHGFDRALKKIVIWNLLSRIDKTTTEERFSVRLMAIVRERLRS